jgi:FdhD protein
VRRMVLKKTEMLQKGAQSIDMRVEPHADQRPLTPDPAVGRESGMERLTTVTHRNGAVDSSSRNIALETPVSLSFNGASHAVMMATPKDLQDFAIGFALTQRIVIDAREIQSIAIVELENGVDCQIWIPEERAMALVRKRRSLAGPTGCGICGVEGIDEAVQPVQRVHMSISITSNEIHEAMQALSAQQPLGFATRATHAAGYWLHDEGLIVAREDVGRHNALDKLAGALVQLPQTKPGAVLLTSRVSIEMVQKTAAMGASMIIAVSAPTSLAIETARAANICLIGVARADGFEVFTHPERVV